MKKLKLSVETGQVQGVNAGALRAILYGLLHHGQLLGYGLLLGHITFLS